MTNARPRKPGTGAVYMPGGHVHGSATDRQDQPSRAPLAVLGRAVTDGHGPAGDRLQAAADTAAAMVAAGQIDCTDAVAAVWIAAQAAGIGGVTALAAISAAFCRAGTP